MARDTTAWPVPAPTHPAQAGGLMAITLPLAKTASQGGNHERSASYQNLIAATEHYQRVLSDFNTQADSAVLTKITAILALL